jgi:pimeloyl-ACP methyl ester carboxylesterase
MRRILLSGALVALITLGSTGCRGLTRGNLGEVQPLSDRERIGNVYLVRGWIGIFSTGIDDIAAKLEAAGVRARVYQQDQWRSLADTIAKRYQSGPREPIVLIGHSYGADGVVAMARRLDAANIPVELLLTLDPVVPGSVPGNVRRCVNLYQSNGAFDYLPWLRGIPLEKANEQTATVLHNLDIRTERRDLLESGLNHFNIEKKPKVQDEVVRQVLLVASPRNVAGGSNVSAHTSVRAERD